MRREARRRQGFAQFALDADGGGLVAPVPVDGRGACIARQLQQTSPAAPRRSEQPRTALAQRGVQPLQRTVQPPARGRAGGPEAFLLRSPEVHRYDGRAACDRREQRGVVREAQVLPEPEDRRGHGTGLTKLPAATGALSESK